MGAADLDREDSMSEESERFIGNRDALLALKVGQTARSLAEDLVALMELLAVHGESGIGADPDTRRAYVDTLVARIDTAIRLEPSGE